jgi:hypothetical protein
LFSPKLCEGRWASGFPVRAKQSQWDGYRAKHDQGAYEKHGTQSRSACDYPQHIVAFLMVAREQSFTRAAAQPGVLAIGAQPNHPCPGNQAWHTPANAHHAPGFPTEAGERLLRTVGRQMLGVTGPLGLKFRVTFAFREIDADARRLLMDVRLPFGISVVEDRGETDQRRAMPRELPLQFRLSLRLARRSTAACPLPELDKGPADSLTRLKRAAERRWAESHPAS